MHWVVTELIFIYGVNTHGLLVFLSRLLQKPITMAGLEKIFSVQASIARYMYNVGAGAYICGEETALIESLEGKRGNPRIKPPFPAVKGVWDCPTVVKYVETLAASVPIINMGGDEYKNWCRKIHRHQTHQCMWQFAQAGVFEIDMTISVEEFIYSDEYCGGIANGKN